ncbi:uncharacterized protein VP01_773g7 [Puccinia sorghi]|uniref:Protein transport protein SFT2 n=1 Tax=Puccinia sorghi TaxID=27349 RepID=A0A0L6UBH4_9BASI|nr:uncharacterized protein VP01_773g7 [Puccinia sorghi]
MGLEVFIQTQWEITLSYFPMITHFWPKYVVFFFPEKELTGGKIGDGSGGRANIGRAGYSWRARRLCERARDKQFRQDRATRKMASGDGGQTSEESFRINMSGFKWARGASSAAHASPAATPVADSSRLSRFTSSMSAYVPLRSNERSNEEEAYPPPPLLSSQFFPLFSRAEGPSFFFYRYYALSRWERTIGFLMCTTGAMICFIISFFTLPLLAVMSRLSESHHDISSKKKKNTDIKPRKFAVSFSLGSMLFMTGFMVLQGPMQHLQHIFSTARLPFTLSYLLSLVATLYFAIVLHSYLGTLISGLIQVIVLVIYFMAYFPGGLTTLRFMGNIGLRGASSYLPV